MLNREEALSCRVGFQPSNPPRVPAASGRENARTAISIGRPADHVASLDIGREDMHRRE